MNGVTIAELVAWIASGRWVNEFTAERGLDIHALFAWIYGDAERKAQYFDLLREAGVTRRVV